MGNKNYWRILKMKKIIILEGGFNEEHEVSLNTSKKVKKSLQNLKYDFDSLIVNPSNFIKKIKNFNNQNIFFNALHGTYGEDGYIQEILEKNNFFYTHSNSKTSKIAFDKNLTKSNIKKLNVPLLKSTSFSKNNLTIDKFLIDNSDLRHVVRRAFIIEKFPYSEIQDNTISENLVPINMLRLKLSFFGALKFDPRSDKWLRICMFQGAPLPNELKNYDELWVYNS